MRFRLGVRTSAAVLGGFIVFSAGCHAPKVDTVPAPESVPADSAAAAEPRPTDAEAGQTSIGYGSQTRRELAVSVATLDERTLDQQRVQRVEELLMGRLAGVTVVRRANGDFSVRIRGASSFYGSTEPLWVVDDMPVMATSFYSAVAGLNPQDIERIDVLKDAGATAVYGSRGANGVILIKTKRAR